MQQQRKLSYVLIVLLLFVLIPTVAARDILSDVDCVIEADTVIEGTLFVLCENLRISGIVNGDVIGGALRAQIDGTIQGDVYLASGQLDLTGQINGNLHFGGLVLNIQAANTSNLERPGIAGGLKAIVLATNLARNTYIEKGVLYFGYQLIANGEISGEINFWGSALVLNHVVNGTVYAGVGNPASDSTQLETLLIPLQFDIDLLNPGLIIGRNAHIRGSIRYSGPAEGEILGRVRGSIGYEALVAPIPTLEEPGSVRLFFGQIFREFITLTAIGLLGVLISPRIVRAPTMTLRSRPFASFSVGLLAFILSFPIWLLVLIVSLLLILLLQITGLQELVVVTAIVVGMINFGSASLFYFVAIFMARALIGLLIGRLILRVVLHRNDIDSRLWLAIAQTIGLGIVAVAVSLPLIGWIFNAAALFLGLGAILLVALEQGRRIRDTLPAPVPAWYAPSPIARATHLTRVEELENIPMMPPLPPVPPMPSPPAAGMENLPEGFDWSFFKDDEP